MEDQIEVNFRLDSEGRTISSQAHSNGEGHRPTTIIDYETKTVQTTFSLGSSQAHSNGEGHRPTSIIDYETKTVQTTFSLGSASNDHHSKEDLRSKEPAGNASDITPQEQLGPDKLLDELLFDCEISDCGLMPRTFWVPAIDGFEPRCSLEQMALDVFHHHVTTATGTTSGYYDPHCSGAEWWVQIRPSPEKVGRYAMHHHSHDNDDTEKNPRDREDDDLSEKGISFHWDKDEDLRLLCGGNTYVHPHLSTVTYLTGIGAPTLTVNCRVHNLTGEWIVPSDSDSPEVFVSWPAQGKHLSFDGRYLHAAPPNLMEDGLFDRQCQFQAPIENNDETLHKRLKRRHRRVTFLVNIWLNYRPFDVKPFPETMLDKMSGYQEKKVHLSFQETTSDECLTVHGDNKGRIFVWPMGDCDSGESIHATIPISEVRSVAEVGGNVRIKWKPSSSGGSSEVVEPGIRLVRETKEETGKAAAMKRPRLDEIQKES